MIFKQAFRVAFVALIWKQYKAAIISTLLLFAFIFVVGNVHEDYLTAVGPENIDQKTFIYKWLAYVSGIAIYLGFHVLRARVKPKNMSDKEKIQESKELETGGDDPFAQIRARKKLRSRADFLMENKEEQD